MKKLNRFMEGLDEEIDSKERIYSNGSINYFN